MIAQADVGMLDGFERALINGRLRMVYQPKISLSDGRLRRVEALVRWDDPELGTVPPSRFVPLAEKHGLIDQMTQWGLRTTLRQWLSWVEQGLDTCLAFNISALNLDQPLYASAPLKQTGRVMAKDENVCLHCGLCAERCPTYAWDMRKFTLGIPYAGATVIPLMAV